VAGSRAVLSAQESITGQRWFQKVIGIAVVDAHSSEGKFPGSGDGSCRGRGRHVPEKDTGEEGLLVRGGDGASTVHEEETLASGLKIGLQQVLVRLLDCRKGSEAEDKVPISVELYRGSRVGKHSQHLVVVFEAATKQKVETRGSP